MKQETACLFPLHSLSLSKCISWNWFHEKNYIIIYVCRNKVVFTRNKNICEGFKNKNSEQFDIDFLIIFFSFSVKLNISFFLLITTNSQRYILYEGERQFHDYLVYKCLLVTHGFHFSMVNRNIFSSKKALESKVQTHYFHFCIIKGIVIFVCPYYILYVHKTTTDHDIIFILF